jgi:hypothetical protein
VKLHVEQMARSIDDSDAAAAQEHAACA